MQEERTHLKDVSEWGTAWVYGGTCRAAAGGASVQVAKEGAHT